MHQPIALNAGKQGSGLVSFVLHQGASILAANGKQVKSTARTSHGECPCLPGMALPCSQ